MISAMFRRRNSASNCMKSADWIADFRENIESCAFAPKAKPGAILAALPKHPPEEGEAFEKILGDIDR